LRNNGDIVFKRLGDDRLAIRNDGSVQFKKIGDDRLAIAVNGNVGIGTAAPMKKFTVEGEEPDIMLNQMSGSPTNVQALSFAVDGMEQSGIHHDKSTGNLVVEFDKADLGAGDILFKRHGDDMLALRNNGDIVFKRLGDDRLAIRNDGEILFKRYGDDRLAIKTNGRVGIGLNDPASKLQVAGAVQVGDDASAPTGENVGAIRYRADGNHSYCEMVMQTGPATYEWVVIVQNIW
jgi:hypothetical protein